MAEKSAFDNEAIKEEYLTALAKDVRNAGLGISILNDLMTDGSFPAKDYDKDTGDPHHHHRKHIHQDVTCKLAKDALTIYVAHLNLSGKGISEQSYPWTQDDKATPKDDGVKQEGSPSPASDASTEPISLQVKTLSPIELTRIKIAEHGGDPSGKFPKFGKTSADTPSRAALADFKATYIKPGDDSARIWDAAMQRIKLAVIHVMTHKVYGLRTVANKNSVRDDFGFTKFEEDATDCAYTRLDKLFNFFPPLEVMINSLEYINSSASCGKCSFTYVNMGKLTDVLVLLNTAYALGGGSTALRLERKDLVTLAYHRSTIDYVHNEQRYAKEMLNDAKESYSRLVNSLVQEPLTPRGDIFAEMNKIMAGPVPDFVYSTKAKGKTQSAGNKYNNKNSTSSSSATGLAYAGTDPEPCKKCTAMKLPAKICMSHVTAKHNHARAKRAEAHIKRLSEKQSEKPAPSETNEVSK